MRDAGRRLGPAVLCAAILAGGALVMHAGERGLLRPGADPEKAIRANNHGVSLMEQFKHQRAMDEFLKTTDLAPRWAPGFVNLGLAALYARKLEPAETAFREALRLDPDFIQAHYGLAILFKTQGKSAEAIEVFEKALRLDGSDPDILYNLGLLHARLREFSRAVDFLKRARRIDPNSMAVRYQLGRALLQSGDADAGAAEMAEYQKLRANPRFSMPTGNQYGEAGRHAMVLTGYEAFEATLSPRSIPVRWSVVGEETGITFVHGGPGGEAAAAAGREEGSVGFATARYGSGLAIGDIDGDGRPDLVFANASADGKARPAIYRNMGGWVFEDITRKSGVEFEGTGTAATLADYDEDGDLDLLLTRLGGAALFQNQPGGVFKDVTGAAGIDIRGFAFGASWGDCDHDGDLDLFVTRLATPGGTAPTSAVLLRNRGDGTFEDVTAGLGLGGPPGGAVGGVFTDLDLDRDADLIVSAAGGPDALMDNRRENGFADVGKKAGLPSRGAGRGVTVGDVDGDGLSDLIFAGPEKGSNRLYLNSPGRRFSAQEIPRPARTSSYGSALFDADNDGDLDLFFTGSAHLFYINDGDGGFEDATAASGLGGLEVKDGRAVGAADLDGDGDLDLVVTRNGGSPILLRNDGGNRNRWLVVAPRGLNSNKDGVGTRIEVQAGAFWQRREVQAGSGYLSQSPGPIHLGLGSRRVADFVRLLWPGGVLQSEMDVPAGQTLEASELDRKGSSCPLLFAWNGMTYGFITDFLGVGGLGLWLAPGVYGQPDPDEYVKIGPGQLAPRDGAYYLQVMENLEEVAYLDEVELITLDHAKDLDVFPNESFGGNAGGPHRVYTIEKEQRIFPVRAAGARGRDAVDTLLKVDRRYPDHFRLHRLAGFAEEHDLTLEFPESVDGGEGYVLFLYGWVDYEYSSTNFAAHQSGLTLNPPVLEMEGDDGLYEPVLDPMGFPAGLPRMMTVDLTTLGPLPSRRMRIRTNMRVFWDQIFLARPLGESEMAERVTISKVPIGAAHLHRRGFPREHSPDGREPKVYDYGILDNTQPFKVTTGDYTRFGRVTELLARTDDRFVVFGKGEEITLEFPVRGLPAVPPGSVRSFILYTSGYCKDMDPHTAHGETVEPLPFRGMSSYPYPEGETYPDDADHRDYRKTYNTRRLEGR